MKKLSLTLIVILLISSRSFAQWATSGTTIHNTNTGNVGINTTTPSQKLDVNGSINMPVTTSAGVGIIFSNGTRFLHNFAPTSSDGDNVFLGGSSGNLTMSLGGGGSYLASGNVGVGYFTLQSLTNGYDNAAFGVESLKLNTTGFGNLAVGSRSLIANTNGYTNVALGTYGLESNTSGALNVAVGYAAGYNSAVTLSTNNNCVFVGYRANSTVNGLINSIAIGDSTQVTQSNQVVLGNTNISQTLLRGNVAIGTTDPKGYKLAVNGTAIANSMTLKPTGIWPDYVFSANYSLPLLSDLKSFINKNQHLPELPSAQDISKDGLNLGEMNASLVKKVEELTLYLIQKDEQEKKQELINKQLENKLMAQQQQLDELNKKIELSMSKLEKGKD